MSSSAIVHVDDFGITIPAPMEPFISTIIHPANLALQERQRDARKLTKRELVDAQKEMKDLRKLLDEAGFYDQYSEYKLLKSRYRLYMQAAETLPEGEERAEQLKLMHQVSARGVALKQALYGLQKDATRYETLTASLKDHQLAVEREQIHQKLNKEMAREAYKWEEILIETLARLGFCHDEWDARKKRTWIDKVKFSEIQITPDAVWYRIYVTQRLLFGSRSALPRHTRLTDIVDEKTLEELSIACQRQVTAHVSYQSGAWLCVNRIGTTDGLLNYVTLEQVLNSYPHDQRELMPIPVGVGDGRNISWIMLAEHPHFLVAGSTGNGKSNFCHAVICSLIQYQSPDELRMCFIDLKDGAEFAAYEDIPHLLMPVVKEVEAAVNVLAQMDALRAERMKHIAAAGCRNILEFNRKFPDKRLPQILIMFDEYARIKARGKEFEAVADRAIGEITALGRAAGVHAYVATQTPYARILPGEAKNNMEVRIAFPLDTIEASRSIVGNGDAARLPNVKGRALVAIGSIRWEVQTPYMRDEDQERALKVARNWNNPDKAIALPETVKMDVFSENEMLDIAVNELGGNLGAEPIWNHGVKHMDGVTYNQLREMVKKYVADHKSEVIEFEGSQYRLKKIGWGWRLIARADVPTSPLAPDADVSTEPASIPVSTERLETAEPSSPEISVEYVDTPLGDPDPIRELERGEILTGEVLG